MKSFAPRIWELVPTELKGIENIDKFKAAIKKWQPNDCPCRLCKDYDAGVGFVNIIG